MYKFKQDLASAYSLDNSNVAQSESKESLLTMPSQSDVIEDKETASKRLAHEIYSNKPLMSALQATDIGTEFADHKYIAKMLHTKVYFAHLYSSWEKSLIENTNKLIRQYIPKDTDFSSLSACVQTEINLRPRKLLDFSSPKQKFLLSLHNSVAFRG